MPEAQAPWWRDVTRGQWFVFAVAALGWMFDTMDQQLFTAARVPAMRELVGKSGMDPKFAGGVATSVFMVGWALGGLIFGVLGDRIGRARTMLFTILVYSAFTGLSALSTGIWDFCWYRFLTGLGVGGEFAVGVALIAETMSDRARPHALGWLQALSAVGNIFAALAAMGMSESSVGGKLAGMSTWRWMFVLGAAPALLVAFAFGRIKEPAKALAATGRRGSYGELFGDPVLRKHALLGLALGFSGVVGLWGIGFFAPDLVQYALEPQLIAAGVQPEDLSGRKLWHAGIAMLMMQIGAFFGMLAFTKITAILGRRPAFALAYLSAMGATLFVYARLETVSDIYWMMPILGFCLLSIFGGFAIYFPELFPTRLRSTGVSFCYNVGRFVAALGPLLLGTLATKAFPHVDKVTQFRYAGMCMCGCFLIGLAALPFLPETKGQPLPE